MRFVFLFFCYWIGDTSCLALWINEQTKYQQIYVERNASAEKYNITRLTSEPNEVKFKF